MAVSDRTLVVWSNHSKVGTLREHNNLWVFEYDPAWTMFDLCPELPRSAGRIEDGSSKRPTQWFFDNLLPEEGARILLAADADIDEADAFGLLAHFGAESAGALTLLGPAETPGPGGRHPLSFLELSARIKALPDVPLSQGGSKRMSLAVFSRSRRAYRHKPSAAWSRQLSSGSPSSMRKSVQRRIRQA